MKKVLKNFLIIVVLGYSFGVWAQSIIIERVVAVINEEIIALSDLVSRLRFALFITQLEDTPQNRQQLQNQVLRTLIREQLQIQEAERLGLTITENEITERVEELARLNGVTRQQFITGFERNAIPFKTLTETIKGDLSWLKVIRSQIRPQVRISEEEVDNQIEHMLRHADKQNFLISRIVLRMSRGIPLQEIRKISQTLLLQIREGARFSDIAGQFSDDPGAATTRGDLGWLREDQIEPPLYQVLRRMKVGEISEPIETTSEIYIVYLRDKRRGLEKNLSDIQIHIQQIIWSYRSGQERERILETLTTLKEQTEKEQKSCEFVLEQMKPNTNIRIEDLGRRTLATLTPPQLQTLVKDLSVGQLSQSVDLAQGNVGAWVVCDRVESTSLIPERESIITRLGNTRLDLLQRRYMRRLYRQAFIDVRL